MAKQTINIGSQPNDNTGDPLRTAYIKINNNFDELYSNGAASNFRFFLNTMETTQGNINIAPAGSNSVVISDQTQVYIKNFNESYDLTTGALIVSGGTAILGNLNVAGALSVRDISNTAIGVNGANTGAFTSISAANATITKSTVANVVAGVLSTSGLANLASLKSLSSNIGESLAGNLSVSGNLNANSIVMNGDFLYPNGAIYTPGGTFYTNSNVASYLLTNTGNINANTLTITNNILWPNGNPFAGTYSNANVASYLLTNNANIAASNIILTGDVYWANSQPFTHYSNSDVSSYLPTFAGNLNPGNLNVTTTTVKLTGGTNGQFLQTDGAGNVTWAAVVAANVGGNAAAAGANTQVQFNDDGVFGGDSTLTFNKTSKILTGAFAGTFNGNANGYQSGYMNGVVGANVPNLGTFTTVTATNANVDTLRANTVVTSGLFYFNTVAASTVAASVIGNSGAILQGANLSTTGNVVVQGNLIASNYTIVGNITGYASSANTATTAGSATYASTAGLATSVGTLASLSVSGDVTLHNGNIYLGLQSSTIPSTNGDLVIEATSDSQLTFKFKGSDGMVRSATLTLV